MGRGMKRRRGRGEEKGNEKDEQLMKLGKRKEKSEWKGGMKRRGER